MELKIVDLTPENIVAFIEYMPIEEALDNVQGENVNFVHYFLYSFLRFGKVCFGLYSFNWIDVVIFLR